MSDGSSASAESAVIETPVSATGGVEVIDVSPSNLPAEKAATEVVAEEKKDPEQPKKPEKVAKKLSQIAERERKVAEKEAALSKQAQDAADQLEQAKTLRATVDQLKTNPSKVLSELGISFNDLAKALLSEEVTETTTPTEQDALKQELNDLKKRLDAKDAKESQAQEDAVNTQLEAAINDIKKVIDNHIATNSDKYDLILATKNQDLVYAIMKESFDQTGEVMMYTDACDAAEEYLTEQAKTLSGSKKIREFVTPTPATEPKRTSFGRTLSAQASQVAAAASGKGPDMSKLSHDERIKALIPRLRFN